MSIEQSLDPQLIEQTKRQIRTLVNEIAQLSKSDVAPEEFHAQFLPRVKEALAAIGGAIWTIEDQGRLALQYQINLQETKLREREEDQMRHGRLLHRVLAGGEGILVPPRSGFGEDDQTANPTDFLLVFGLIKTELENVAVVEIFQRADSGPATQKGYLRFLLEMCDLASDFFKTRQLRHFGDRQVLWTQLEEFTRSVHASLDPRATAYTIANEGRRLIECDRVSVAIRRGRRCAIESVSGQDLFDKRSNTVRLLGRLATAVVNSGEPMWYTGDTSNMAPQVEDAVQEYVDESHTKCVAVLPLVRKVEEHTKDEEENAEQKVETPETIGALIVEQIEDIRVPQKMLQRVDVVTQHSSTALANALEHHNLFLMPVWKTMGKARWLVKARTLPKTLAITGAALAAILALVLVPWDFKQHSEGTLEPVVKRDVFAGVDGVVDQVLVKHGSSVKGPEGTNLGTPLVKLRNTDLNVQRSEVKGKLAATQAQIDSIRSQLSESSRQNNPEKYRLHGEWARLDKEKLTYQTQQALYDEKMKELEVYSPISGEVVTWDPENLLIQRPVQRGQVLLRVANPDGDWELELHMPEKRMGHITRARLAAKEKDPKADLAVEFVLATDPDKKFQGTIKEVEENAEVRGEEGNTVLIKVSLKKNELPQPLRPGASVSAKVACGKRPLGYVFLCDAIAYVQKTWFRWF